MNNFPNNNLNFNPQQIPPNFNPQQMNPNLFNVYQNQFLMNPNFNMYNQIQLNQMLINYLAQFPGLLGIFLYNNNQSNNNNNNMKGFQTIEANNTMGTGVKGGNLPRKELPNYDSYPWYKGPRINVIFEVSTGPKVNIPAPPNETVEGILNKFCERAGVSPLLLKKEITRICFFNPSIPNSNILFGVGATRNNSGVTSFTFLSVAWADNITATAKVNSFTEYNSDRIFISNVGGTF